MRDAANRHRRDVEFEVGDLVWLKLQPYRQHSVARPESAKLARRYYGPFEVLARIGPVAYRLRLPDGSRIHNVFHVSLLKEYVAGSEATGSPGLPSEFAGSRPITLPAKILEHRVVWRDGKPTDTVRVQWSDGKDSISWEPWDSFKTRFPELALEDKDAANGGGVDTTSPSTDEAGTPDQTNDRETANAPDNATDKEKQPVKPKGKPPQKGSGKKHTRSGRQVRRPDKYGR